MITIKDGFLIRDDAFIIGLSDVNFISWRQNEDNLVFWIKLHLEANGKEAKIRCDTREELDDVLYEWKKARGEEQ